MENKIFARTVRMKPQIRDYVEKQPGTTFAEKFENMVIRCEEKEDEIRRNISKLDAQCQGHKARINALVVEIQRLGECKLIVDEILNTTEKLKHNLECI